MKTTYPKRFLAIAILFSLAAFSLLDAANRVVVKAEALDEYLMERARNPDEKVQTYLFMKGKYYGGGIADPSMDEVTFEDLVINLADHLKRQKFYPEGAGEEEHSDLLIVVHYGVTGARPDSLTESMGYHSIEEMNDKFGNTGFIWDDTTDSDALLDFNLDEDYEEDSAAQPIVNTMSNVDPGVEFNYNASLSIEEAHNAASFKKAQLLGMEQAFDPIGSPREQWELNTMINQERYFVVLNVYDFQELRKGEKILLWRTRYNIRSTGQPFDRAIADMNEIAGDYFGTHQKGLVIKRASDESRVNIGNIEVIEEQEERVN